MFDQIVSGLMARGIPEHIAIGIAGRMNAESGLNPGINELKPVVPGSRGGYGLNQWTGPRRVAYEAYATERGLPFDDLNAQLDFTKFELDTTEKAAWDALQGTKTADEAGRVFMEKFLRPGIPHADMRPSPPSNFKAPVTTQQTPVARPDTFDAPMTWADKAGLLGDAMASLAPQQQPAPLMPVRQPSAYTPVKRNPLEIYQRFFGTLG